MWRRIRMAVSSLILHARSLIARMVTAAGAPAIVAGMLPMIFSPMLRKPTTGLSFINNNGVSIHHDVISNDVNHAVHSRVWYDVVFNVP